MVIIPVEMSIVQWLLQRSNQRPNLGEEPVESFGNPPLDGVTGLLTNFSMFQNMVKN